MKVTAVIPAYNESRRIGAVISALAPYVQEIIVVDDGSTDETEAVAQAAAPVATVVRHRVNLGKGAALKTGCELALRRGSECIVILDADGQHVPSEVPLLVNFIERREADFVVGTRRGRESMPFVAVIGNAFLSAMTSLFFGIRVSDTQSGYRAFRSTVFDQLRWRSTGYSVETEMLVNAGKHGLRVKEVPIQTIYHDRYKGTTIVDGLRIFFDLIRWRFL